MHTPLVRMIDACINRATEGLRVAEDFARFLLDDPHLTALCKELRHELTAALASISTTDLLAARETTQDVGRELAATGEYTRDDPAQVVSASFKRAQQALRSLEEYSKIIDSSLARRLEALRYRTYTLERTFGIRRHSVQRLEAARLCVLVDGGPSEAAFDRLVTSLVAEGASAIQLRAKELNDRQQLGRARLLAQICRGTKTLAIINDRPDIAVLCGADGVHLGQDDLAVKDARTIVGTHMLVGVSTHSVQEALVAANDGANYLGVGPVFASTTKDFTSEVLELTGLDLVQAAAAQIRLPWFAIGGIDTHNLPQVLASGARRVAVSAAIVRATDPASVVRSILKQLEIS